MPLYEQGGLVGSKAGLQGIQDVVDRFFAGKDTARRQAQDDAAKIWEMAQQDPLIMRDPRAQQIFNKAGWPIPTITPKKESPQDEMARLRMIELRDVLERSGLIDREGRRIELPSQEETPQPSGPGWWSRLWGAKASPQGAPAVDPNALVSPPWEQLIPQADKWLEPKQFTGFIGPRPTTRPPSRLMQAIRNIDTTPFRGMAPAQVPTGRTPTTAPMPAAKEPTTQEEFEQTVREMAKIDKKKARAYYDKWVGKWQ